MKPRVAIIGAGASGLPSARWALLYGLEPVVFEENDEIGGLWRYKKEGRSVMFSTIVNSSKEMTAYSDFPPPPNFANYMHNTQMWEYLRLYAQEFGLYDYIRFNHKVKSIRRAKDYVETGKWLVEYVDSNNNETVEEFDCVLLAQGRYMCPHKPSFPNQDRFKGRIVHSIDYKRPNSMYEDKNNVIVGIGNSGLDVAVELSRVSKQTILSFRRGVYIKPRVGDFGVPNDLNQTLFETYVVKNILPTTLKEYQTVRKLEKRFDHTKYGLKPTYSIFEKHSTFSDEIAYRIISGTLTLKPNIKEFTETGIVWSDDTVTENVDNVILCTGYSFNFDLIEDGKLIEFKKQYAALYKYIFPLELSKHNTLGIIGLMQPTGAIINASEIQARFFFHAYTQKVYGNKSILPSYKSMKMDIEKTKRGIKAKSLTELHQFWVDSVLYMDDLADLIGCRPNPLAYVFSDPKLAFALTFKPYASYVYRLQGPHAWEGARDAILGIDKRVDTPFPTLALPISKHDTDGIDFWIYVLTMIIILSSAFPIFSMM